MRREGSLIPRPLPDFISQPWRKIGEWPEDEARERVLLLDKLKKEVSIFVTVKGTKCLKWHRLLRTQIQSEIGLRWPMNLLPLPLPLTNGAKLFASQNAGG